MLELVWGKGYMTPGGPENVKQAVQGLDLRDKLVLDIGSGIGGPALVLAGELGARVIGLDLEAPLIRRAEAYAREAGLAHHPDGRCCNRRGFQLWRLHPDREQAWHVPGGLSRPEARRGFRLL